jgi:hypothetical protein
MVFMIWEFSIPSLRMRVRISSGEEGACAKELIDSRHKISERATARRLNIWI